VKIDEDEVVLKTDDGEEDFPRSRVESITPVAGAKPEGSSRARASTRKRAQRRRKACSGRNKKPARSRNEGVSIGGASRS
jgi:hypothetical protein